MSALVELSSVQTKNNRIERISGTLPNKVRLAETTAISLINNIDNKLIEKRVKEYNEEYNVIHSAVEASEKEKAEEIERSKILGSEDRIKDLEARIELDDKIAKIVSVENMLPIISKSKIKLFKLDGRIGTYNGKFAINVKKGFKQKPPKALSVSKLCAYCCKETTNKIDLYQVTKKSIGVEEEPKEELQQVEVVEEKIPNWKSLFQDVNPIEEKPVEKIKKEKENKQEDSNIDSLKISEEDLSNRRLLSQISDEFKLIEDYEKSKNGVPFQFKDGFESRKRSLLNILTKLTGVEISQDKSNIDEKINDNTEFQDLIEEINGYKEPTSEEEHNRIQESLNEYYASEDTLAKIDELKAKDVLYTFNMHMDDVIKNEEKQNNLVAKENMENSIQETKKIEEEQEKTNELDEIKKGAQEQARMLKTLYNYMDERDRFEKNRIEEEQKEKEKLLDGAKEQAQLLHEYNVMIDNSQEEKNEEDIAFNEEANINEKEVSVEEDNEFSKVILDSAQEEAERLNFNNIISDSAQKEAERINFNNIILDSAQKEAERINFDNTILDSAQKEAERLNFNNIILDSAQEEAKKLHSNNERLNLLESADIQARIIFNENRKYDLMKDAEELKSKLNLINEETNKINDLIEGYNGANGYSVVTDNEKIENEYNDDAYVENNSTDNVEPIQLKENPIENAQEETPVVSESNEQIEPTNNSDLKGIPNNIIALDDDNRYAELTSKSRPILVNAERVDNIRHHFTNKRESNIGIKKRLLTSLKEDLEKENYSFLKKADDGFINEEEVVKAA